MEKIENGLGGDHVLVRERAEDNLDAEENPARLGGPDLAPHPGCIKGVGSIFSALYRVRSVL